MIGLADCNNFFVSCERVFRPQLLGKPVIVLSNNDGCAVALSNEAKALWFKRGDPYFRIKEQAERQGVVAFSGNHRLYGDMSRRVMMTLRSFCSAIEVYSVDEAFIFPEAGVADLAGFGRHLVKVIRRNTGIPVSIGFAPSKTLAKIASGFAKKYPGYRGACVMDTDDKIRKALSLTPVENVWGVGRRNAPKLRRQGIADALQLADMDEERVRELFNIVGLRMWKELNGTPCIGHELVEPRHKTLTCSTSFSQDIYTLDEIRRAVVSYTTTVAQRLRRQHLLAVAVEVFLCTNRFHTQSPQYFDAFSIKLDDPTADTATLSAAAVRALERVWRPGYGFKKAGVTITKCVAEEAATHSLFADREDAERRKRLMEAVDRLNASPANHHCVRLASMDSGIVDLTRREHASRLYTTRLSDILEINAR